MPLLSHDPDNKIEIDRLWVSIQINVCNSKRKSYQSFWNIFAWMIATAQRERCVIVYEEGQARWCAEYPFFVQYSSKRMYIIILRTNTSSQAITVETFTWIDIKGVEDDHQRSEAAIGRLCLRVELEEKSRARSFFKGRKIGKSRGKESNR